MFKRLFLLLFLASSPAFGADAATGEDLSAYKTADALWTHITDQFTALTTTRPKDIASMKSAVLRLSANDQAFVAQYPKDARMWDAKMMIAQLGGLATRLKMDIAPTPEALEKQLTEIASSTEAPKMMRAQASALMISQALQLAISGKGDAGANWDAADMRIEQFQKDFANFSFGGSRPAIILLRSGQLDGLENSPDTARYQALLAKLAQDPNPDIVSLAQQKQGLAQRLTELKTKPVELKFTAVDGTPVDLAKLRGKVVLIDFWATWCGPCVQEVPQVVELYEKLHKKGFEIIGISLDESLDSLQRFTTEKDMSWPQYFDGKRWDNAISRSFGITSIPAMWLIDKKGMLVNANARDHLTADVEKLLKAP